MARTPIDAASIIDISGPQLLTVAADAADIPTDAGDLANGNEVTLTGGEWLLVHNTGASAYTVTLTAAPDSVGRSGTIAAYSVGAGELAIFGPLPQSVWKQADGMLYVDVSNVAVELAILRP